jgi:parallel beta-helix repeat protein
MDSDLDVKRKMKCLFRKILVTGIAALFLITTGATFLKVNMFAYAAGPIYIRADGSIEGTAFIQSSDNVTYVFTADINDCDFMEVQRSNIIVDGNGHVLNSSGAPEDGISVMFVNNVTIENVSVQGFGFGIYLYDAANNTISGNNVTNNYAGIGINSCENNTVSGNTVTGNNAYGIYLYSSSNYNSISGNNITNNEDGVYLESSSGNTVSGNNITNCSYGIYLVMQNIANDVTDLSVTIGDIILANNTISSNSDGIFVEIYEVGYGMYGNSSVAIGDLRIANNVINSSGKGINVDGFHYIGNLMFNSTTFSMGNIEITGNTVDSSQQGIYLHEIEHLGEEMYDDSRFTMGSILVNNNTVDSNNYGIAPWFIRYFGKGLHGNSSFTMNNIEFCRNVINSTIDAIGFSQFNSFGTDIYGNSSFSMGNVLVNDNILHSYIWLTSFGYFGSGLYENSSCTMGSVEFCRNVINSVGKAEDGITFYNLLPFGYEMHDYSSFIMGDFSVSSNTIVADGDRFGIACTQGSGGFGINVYDNASALTGNYKFAGNNISFTRLGFNLWMVKGAIIRNNTIRNSTDTGIFLPESSDNHIYHNNFINNTIQAYVTPNYNNTWDNGYPSGGNYWSNYNGTDEYKGPDQNIPGSDFRGDKEYKINDDNIDHYPLMIPYETSPPAITILSPENKTYAVNTSIPLTFTIDEPADWISYSLNGQANVTITGNTTLPVLSDGSHYVVLYANDTFDNMGISNVYFTVDTTPPAADAGPDQTVDEDTVVTFDGSASTDANGITTYTWTFTDLTPQTLSGKNPTYTFATPGTYTVTLEVADPAGNTATDNVTITVLDVTDPVANAGSDRTVNEDVSTTLDGSASADNVGITGYTWTFTDVTLKTLTGDKPAYTFSNPGVYTITLNATDATGNWAIDTVSITVLDVTDPVANAGQDQTVNVGATVTFDAGGSTDNVGIVSYEWDFGDGTSGTGITATHEFANAGTYTVTLTVEDTAGNQATDTITVTVLSTEIFPTWIVAGAGVAAVGIAAAAIILWKRRK